MNGKTTALKNRFCMLSSPGYRQLRKKRLRLARLSLKNIWSSIYAEPQGQSLDAIEAEIKSLATQLQQQLAIQAERVARGKKLWQNLQQALQEWQTVL